MAKLYVLLLLTVLPLGGIAAGTLAAKAMSVAYTTNVGVGVVSALQSVGAAGTGWYTYITGGLAGAGASKYICRHFSKDKDGGNV